MEMDVITVNLIIKNKSTTISHGLTLIDHRHDLKMFKHFAVKPLACGSWFHLSFEHVDFTSMVDKSTDHRELLLISCLDTNPYCSTPFHFQTKKKKTFSVVVNRCTSHDMIISGFLLTKRLFVFSSVRPCLLQKHSLWVLTCLQGLLCLQMLGSLMEKISDLLVPLI